MTHFERLDVMLESKGGFLRTADAIAAGISKPYFYEYVKSRQLEQAAHGVYLSKDAWADPMYLLGLRCEQAVFSHDTALFLHDLTDREPMQYTVTVKTGYNPSRLTASGVKVYTVKKELHALGLAAAQTPFGHEVAVYDRERTICDVVRSRGTMEAQSFQDAIKRYSRGREKNLRRLMQYAQAFHIEKILRQYMEVLL